MASSRSRATPRRRAGVGGSSQGQLLSPVPAVQRSAAPTDKAESAREACNVDLRGLSRAQRAVARGSGGDQVARAPVADGALELGSFLCGSAAGQRIIKRMFLDDIETRALAETRRTRQACVWPCAGSSRPIPTPPDAVAAFSVQPSGAIGGPSRSSRLILRPSLICVALRSSLRPTRRVPRQKRSVAARESTSIALS